MINANGENKDGINDNNDEYIVNGENVYHKKMSDDERDFNNRDHYFNDDKMYVQNYVNDHDLKKRRKWSQNYCKGRVWQSWYDQKAKFQCSRYMAVKTIRANPW